MHVQGPAAVLNRSQRVASLMCASADLGSDIIPPQPSSFPASSKTISPCLQLLVLRQQF